MQIKVIPNLHPSAVIRNKNKFGPIFKRVFEQVSQSLTTNYTSESKNQSYDTSINIQPIMYANSETFIPILSRLKELGYKLIDVQRYKDFVGNDIIDQGIFARFSNGEDRVHVFLNDVRFFYFVKRANQSPDPLIFESDLIQEKGPTAKSIVNDRYKALKMDKNKVYYDFDFQIDDWLVFQIKKIIPDEPTYTIGFFDIEVHSEDGVFPNERDANYPISTISFVVKNQFYQLVNNELITKNKIDKNKIHEYIKQNNVSIENFHLIHFDNEKDMLIHLAKLFKEFQIDVLTAWNIYFDINYIANRCKRLNIDTEIFSPINKPMYPSGKFGFHIIPGIIIADLLELYKSYEKREIRYTLDYIVEKNLGLNKVKYEGTLSDLLHNDPNLYIAYSAVDTKLIQQLEAKKGNLELHLMLKDLSWVAYLNSYSTLAQIDGLMYQYAKKEGYALRQRPLQADKSSAFVGAFVREPRKGFIPWVIDLDASSMYPSIMISLNISPETFVGFIQEGSNPTFMEKFLLTDEVDDEEVTVILDPNKDKFQQPQTIRIKVKDLKKKIYNSDLTISFSGAIFDRSKKGFLIQILEDLISRRKKYKEEALRLLASSDPEERSLGAKYNVIQKALKVLANAIYGAMGNQAYRFFDTRVSVTITLTGQYEIKFVSGITENLIKALLSNEISDVDEFQFELTRDVVHQAEKEQHYVFYSDTDSSFIDIYELLALNYPKIHQEYEKLSNGNIDDFLDKVLQEAKERLKDNKPLDDLPLHNTVCKMFAEKLD